MKMNVLFWYADRNKVKKTLIANWTVYSKEQLTCYKMGMAMGAKLKYKSGYICAEIIEEGNEFVRTEYTAL